MAILTHMLHREGPVAAIQVAQPASNNPVVRFYMDVEGADPSPNGNLVVLQNGRVLRPGANPATVPDCEVYPLNMREGTFVVTADLLVGDILVLQDWRYLDVEQAERAMVRIAEVGGLR